jgi:hypothetical protein
VVRPCGQRPRGVDDRTDDTAVVRLAVVAQLHPERQARRNGIGFVPFDLEAEPRQEGSLGEDPWNGGATLLLLGFAEPAGLGRH